MIKKKKRLLVLIVTSLIGGYFMMIATNFENRPVAVEAWSVVISEKDPAFRLEMPGVPRHTVAEVSITTPLAATLPTATISVDDVQGNTYLLNLISLTPVFQHFSKETLFRIPLSPLLSAPDSVLLSFKMTEDSAIFEIGRTDAGKSFRGIVRLKDNFLFIQAISYAGLFPEKGAKKFTQSLTF